MRYPNSLIFVLLVLSSSCAVHNTFRSNLVPVSPGWSRTMVNAAIFRSNSIVSYQEFQVVAFYDSAANVVLAKRNIKSSTWEVMRTPYTGNALDAHNVINIMIDGDGFIHMAWDHHNNTLNYCKGIEPLSLKMGPKESMLKLQEEKVSYSEFYRLPSGDLLFVYRDGSSGNGNMVMNRYDHKTKHWERVQDNLISGESQRSAYWQIHVSENGAIHVSWVWREHYHVETNHDMCYAVSHDEGRTWTTSEGRLYNLPITLETAEYAARIPQNRDLINQTSITADDQGHPFIATYFQAASDRCPQYYIIHNQNGEWRTSRVTSRTSDFDLGGAGTRSIPVSRPKLLYYKDPAGGNLLMIYRDEEHLDRVCLAHTSLRDLNWKTVELTSFSVDRWEPSFDTELWKRKKLHIYVQKVGQESGEKPVALPPQMVSVLEVSVK